MIKIFKAIIAKVFGKKKPFLRPFSKKAESFTVSAASIDKWLKNGFYSKMLKIKPTVIHLLQKYPETRDNDAVLLFMFWEEEYGGKFWDYEQFKFLMINDRLEFPDTITRTRRKLQADHPELRGELYEIRKRAETAMTSQIALDFD